MNATVFGWGWTRPCQHGGEPSLVEPAGISQGIETAACPRQWSTTPAATMTPPAGGRRAPTARCRALRAASRDLGGHLPRAAGEPREGEGFGWRPSLQREAAQVRIEAHLQPAQELGVVLVTGREVAGDTDEPGVQHRVHEAALRGGDALGQAGPPRHPVTVVEVVGGAEPLVAGLDQGRVDGVQRDRRGVSSVPTVERLGLDGLVRQHAPAGQPFAAASRHRDGDGRGPSSRSRERPRPPGRRGGYPGPAIPRPSRWPPWRPGSASRRGPRLSRARVRTTPGRNGLEPVERDDPVLQARVVRDLAARRQRLPTRARRASWPAGRDADPVGMALRTRRESMPPVSWRSGSSASSQVVGHRLAQRSPRRGPQRRRALMEPGWTGSSVSAVDYARPMPPAAATRQAPAW